MTNPTQHEAAERVSELKPCPFCGAPAWMEPWHGGLPTKQMISCSSETCDVCPIVTGETPAEAIAAWNLRAHDAGQAGVVVKPLEWKREHPNSYEAQTITGKYYVRVYDGLKHGAYQLAHRLMETVYFDTIDEAKIAATNDHRTRILSALSTKQEPSHD